MRYFAYLALVMILTWTIQPLPVQGQDNLSTPVKTADQDDFKKRVEKALKKLQQDIEQAWDGVEKFFARLFKRKKDKPKAKIELPKPTPLKKVPDKKDPTVPPQPEKIQPSFANQLNLISQLLAAKKYKEAVEVANKVLKLFPPEKVSRAYLYRSQANMGLKNYRRAEIDLNAYLKSQPKSAQGYYLRARAKYLQGKHRTAILDCTRSLQIDPKNDEAYYLRSRVRVKFGSYKNALADIDDAIKIDPKNAAYYAHRGVIHEILRRYNEALKNYDESLAINPKQAEVYINRGVVHLYRQDYHRALENFTRAIALDPKRDRAYLNRAVVYMRLKQYDKAVKDLNQTVKLNPKRALAYYNLGVIHYYAKKDTKQAIVYLEQYLKVDSKSRRAQRVKKFLANLKKKTAEKKGEKKPEK